MTQQQIKWTQERVGTEPDGFWGPKSTAAAQRHLRSLMPKPNPWPETSETALRKFYGSACDESLLINLPAPVPMFFEGKKIRTVRCHEAVADSLERILRAAYIVAPEVVKTYDGCYNCRKIAGSSVTSLHARGAAIDIDARRNGAFTHWPTRAWMPILVMECFACEGWLSAGVFWSRDSMHHQATR
jgi:hypothetical protein